MRTKIIFGIGKHVNRCNSVFFATFLDRLFILRGCMVLILSIGYEVIHDGYVLLKSSSGIRLRSACEFGFPCGTWLFYMVFFKCVCFHCPIHLDRFCICDIRSRK